MGRPGFDLQKLANSLLIFVTVLVDRLVAGFSDLQKISGGHVSDAWLYASPFTVTGWLSYPCMQWLQATEETAIVSCTCGHTKFLPTTFIAIKPLSVVIIEGVYSCMPIAAAVSVHAQHINYDSNIDHAM